MGNGLNTKLHAGWRKVGYQVPLPVRLPWGDWWVTSNDVMSQHIRERLDFEEGEKKFLKAFLQPGMTVLDIGAHHGLYTLLASHQVGSLGRVVAFEPSPRERKHLQQHIWINRRRNVQIEPLALGRQSGLTEMFICLGRETGCNSLRPPAVPEPTHAIQVRITTLDGYLEGSSMTLIDLLKLDVEGAELEVLQGAVEWLRRTPRPVILIEMADVRTEPWGYRSREIYQFLAARSFQWFSVTDDGRLQACPPKESFHENLVALPEEKLAQMGSFVES